MTKAEERNLLEQIADLIKKAGDDSYIGKAFEGCIEDARQNIDDDFWNSYKDRYERADADAVEAQKEARDNRQAYTELLQTHLGEVERLTEELRIARERLANEHENCIKNWNNFREQEDRAEALELENIKLKAKLYDLLCK